MTVPPSARRWLLLALGAGISMTAAILATRGVDLDRTWRIVQRADGGLLLVAVGVLAVQVIIRSARWRVLLPEDGPARVAVLRVVPVALVGYLGNTLLPARLGEAVRGVALARRERLPVPETLGSVLLERVLDTLTLASLGVSAGLLVGLPDWVIVTGAVGVAVSAAAIAVLTLAPRLLRRLATGPLAVVIGRFSRLVHGAAVARRPRAVAAAVALGGVAWTLDATIYWLAGRSVGVELSPLGAIIVATVVALSTAIPSAPGYVGTFELAAVAAAGALGIDPAVALAFALVAHAIAVVPIVVAGAISLALISRDLSLPARGTWALGERR